MTAATLRTTIALALASLAFSPTAWADDDIPGLPEITAEPLRIEAAPSLSFTAPPPKAPEDSAPPPEKHRFGERGGSWWTAGAGVAYDFDEAIDVNFLRLAYSYFLAEDVELSVELNGWHFQQSGPNAWGINPAVVFRWHFFDNGSWTAYADIGVGILLASNEVPSGGTNVDFTPRIGVGVTKQLTDAGLRAQLGLRWHHISNARIAGDHNNPSRDSLMLYGGLQWPF
jgi:hypothetical protein